MDSVRLVDSEKAALRATKEVKGGSHTAAMTVGIVATGTHHLASRATFSIDAWEGDHYPQGNRNSKLSLTAISLWT